MENLPEHSKNQALQLKERATGLIATLTDPARAREFERGLTIGKIVDSALPVSEIVRETGFKSVAQTLDIHLTRCVAQFNRNNNLNDQQIKTLVEDLIDKYPAESVEDFILCFKMARQEEFEVPMWLDSSVVFGWMRQYLDRKYETLERKLKKERADKEGIVMPERPEALSDFAKAELERWRKEVEATEKRSKMPSMTDAEIRRNGQVNPPKKTALTAGLAWFYVLGIAVEASDWKHAKQTIRRAIKSGELEFGISLTEKSRRK